MVKILLCVILLFAIAFPGAAADSRHTSFENLRIDEGSYTVYSIYEDSYGLLYMGTDNGLYIFDGYAAKSACPAEEYTGGHINSIIGFGGLIYLGCDDGIRIFDPSIDNFVKTDIQSPANIRALGVDGDALLIGSFSGLFRYIPENGNLTPITSGIRTSVVYAIAQDVQGNHYIGTYNDLSFLPKGGDKALPLPLPYGEERHFFVNALTCDRSSGSMIIGAEGGLYEYDPANRMYSEIAGMASNSCKALTFDTSGRLWVGTDNGLYSIAEDGQMTHYVHDSRLAGTLSNNVVWCILAHECGQLWVGTDDGLSSLHMSDDFETIPLYVMTGRGDGNRIDCILLDSRGTLWLGGSNGLIRHEADGTSEWYRVDSDTHPIPHNRIRSIFEDSHHRLWVAGDCGILLYDNVTKQFSRRRIVSQDGKRNANWAYSIAEDDDGLIWVGSYLGGLMAVDADTLAAESLQPRAAKKEYNRENGTLPNDFFNQMATDREGNRWAIFFRSGEITMVSAQNGAASKFDFEKEAGSVPACIIADPTDNGVWVAYYGGVAHLAPSGKILSRTDLPTPRPESILAMANVDRYICIVTAGGIWRVERATGEIEMLDLPVSGYASVFYDSQNNKLIFGGIDEIVQVSGGLLSVTRATPPLWLTDIEINGQRYIPEGTSVRNIENLRLAHDQNNLSIRFSPLDHRRPTRRHYEYRLKGLDRQWTTLDDGSNLIHFLNLRPGKYVLQIRAVGAVNNGTFEFPISISQPWFWSWWARSFYLMIAAGVMAYAIVRLRRRRRDEIEKVERETALESIRRRIDFMTNLSHEFKTPLSLIIGPLSKLIRDTPANRGKAELEGIYSHAMALNGLIQSALETGRMNDADNTLILSEVDVVELARGVFDNFREAFPEKNFVFSSEISFLTTRIDVLKMESVFNNLISNACKYSHEQATIALSIELIDGLLRITVSDDGVGIPSEELQMVFQRLFQSTRTVADGKGTGIGLYMVKKYVEMHHGTIIADNNGAGGARFTITIPAEKVSDDAISDEKTHDSASARMNMKKILVVEDNHAVSRFICEILRAEYECITASNGRAGLAVLGGVTPDLIIADIMMPVMDGLEMSRRIRANPRFAEVPVILLSAKDDAQTHANAAKVGVTVFISKPFDAIVLTTQVRNLLARTENIRATARRELITAHHDKAAPQSPDEEMLAKIAEAIESNIDNADFNVATLSENSGIQSKTLYRLIKKYIGVSPVDYIRSVRLKRAAMLLEDDKFTVAEVMYMVGFSSASYFSKCFSTMFGKTPRQYRADNDKQSPSNPKT